MNLKFLVISIVAVFAVTEAWGAGENNNKSGISRVEFEKFASEIANKITKKLISDEVKSKFVNQEVTVNFSNCFRKEVVSAIFNPGEEWVDEKTFPIRMDAFSTDGNEKSVAYCFFKSGLSDELMALKMKTAKESGNSANQFTGLDDLKAGGASLKGKQVRVRGEGIYAMNSLILRENANDMSPIFVDINKVKVNQRKNVVNQCSNIEVPCNLSVYGTVNTIGSIIQIVAEEIN